MRKYLILFLVLITVIYAALERYLKLTDCGTYKLKVYKGGLYLRYDILTNEMLEPELLGKAYICKRYKTVSPDIFVKNRLKKQTYTYKEINNNYYIRIPVVELLDGRMFLNYPFMFEKTTKSITGDKHGY